MISAVHIKTNDPSLQPINRNESAVFSVVDLSIFEGSVFYSCARAFMRMCARACVCVYCINFLRGKRTTTNLV